MKRLFYTCALEAALMAKHHGVKFKTAKKQNLCFDGFEFITEKDRGIYIGEKYFVHPDSMGEFKIKEDDVVEVEGFIYGIVNSFDEHEVAVQCYDVYYRMEIEEPVIIRRNERPFITPQIEE
jgi:hypothetical protein